MITLLPARPPAVCQINALLNCFDISNSLLSAPLQDSEGCSFGSSRGFTCFFRIFSRSLAVSPPQITRNIRDTETLHNWLYIQPPWVLVRQLDRCQQHLLNRLDVLRLVGSVVLDPNLKRSPPFGQWLWHSGFQVSLTALPYL